MAKALRLPPEQNLVDYPEKALEPHIAYKIMSLGMREGLFTGKKLRNYLTTSKTDYREARRIINGTDKWKLIKGYAEAFEHILKESIDTSGSKSR